MDQLEVGKRYEVVISNFYGGAFVRYRMHDLMEVTSLGNTALGVRLPQFRFVGRSGDFIDLSGFAGLIDERQLKMAIDSSGVSLVDWVVSKEYLQNGPILHLYVEPALTEAASPEQMSARIHEHLKELNADYADIEKMLGFVPLTLTLLTSGTFNRYMKHQVAQGADMAHLKPARIQPTSDALQMLRAKSTEG
jgi:hypothetical protein